MVSQFVSTHQVPLLGDIDFHFPEGTHAIGRLDKESEGIIEDSTINKLREGVSIEVENGKEYITKPTDVSLVNEPENLFSSGYVLHERIPNSWLEIILTEGKFHQVRKMVKAVRHPCKRLIRVSIEDLTLGDLKPGEVGEITEEEFFGKLKL